MAQLLAFPGKYFFYPIGNTSAVCMTRDLAPEEPANILLLGCGDPRNVLYTVFQEPSNMKRALDFTCCDYDPGVLARNALLLTMVADQQTSANVVWNTFFHMYLDQASHAALVLHCQKLIGLSDGLKSWNAGPYGRFLKFSTTYTLMEVRRHWRLYADLQDLPPQRMTVIKDAFPQRGKSTNGKTGSSASRSTGPTLINAEKVLNEQSKNYWTNGVTFTDPKRIKAASLINPTIVYSLAGERCCLHYGTDPMAPFHLASLFGNVKGPVTVLDAVKAAMREFEDWCRAFHTAVTSPTVVSPIVRLFLGEATAVCRCLQAFATTGTLKLGIPHAQWKAQIIHLNEADYLSDHAPSTFNVIDTSNLVDYIGLLNVLIAGIPILSKSNSSGVIYTESLLFKGQDATKEFAELLHGDITTFGLLLDLCPVDYLSGFTTRSNTHELLAYQAAKKETTQFHQVNTWKSPASGDVMMAVGAEKRKSPIFDPIQLGTFLYDMYHQLFEQEDSPTFWAVNARNAVKAVAHSNILHYSRETFVLFLKIIRERLDISKGSWSQVMDRFFELQVADKSMPMDTLSFNDLCAHLYLHGIYTSAAYYLPTRKIGRFSNWTSVSPVIRIIVTVPRANLNILLKDTDRVGTPILECHVRGISSQNTFASVRVAFGRVLVEGSQSSPKVIVDEDPEGWDGNSSLIASFTMPSWLLTEVEPPENLSVCFSVRSTPGTVHLIKTLGLTLSVYEAKLMDTSHVHVLPEQPLPAAKSQTVSLGTGRSSCPNRGLKEIGTSEDVLVELDEQCELVASLTVRVLVQHETVKSVFQAGGMPSVAQISPCVMRISIGGRSQDVGYPFPVIGSENRLRLARKSLYIEVIVVVFGPFKPDGMKINLFSVVESGTMLRPWNIHRVNLLRLPLLDIKARNISRWLDPHVGSMLSSRERSLRKKHENDLLMFVKDTIHSIFVRASRIQGGASRRLFALVDKATNNCDTIMFINGVRFDLPSHTLICDGYVMPLTKTLIATTEQAFGALVTRGDLVNIPVYEGEMRSWKYLLPALVERCRVTWSHGDDCEYKLLGRVPLTDLMESDPLCSCGRGKDIDDMDRVALWSKFAPYVTRIALSPLFAVSYLETVGRDPSAHKCFVCRGKGKPKMMKCSGCKKVQYCSRECQRKDWPKHKLHCKA